VHWGLSIWKSPRPTRTLRRSDRAPTGSAQYLRESRYLPATTTDGHTVEVAANVANAKQASVAIEAGAEGVGLMRTEFLFLERTTAPDEEEQYRVYRDMTEAMAGAR